MPVVNEPSLSHHQFLCLSASGEGVLTLAPKPLLERLRTRHKNISTGPASELLGRKLGQPLQGAQPESWMGMLPTMPAHYVADFLAEQRCGKVERAMQARIGQELGQGFIGAPVAAPALASVQRSERRPVLGSRSNRLVPPPPQK